MKTPRDLLLERHRQAQPKLDAIRRDVLASAKQMGPKLTTFSLRDVFHSFRWHLAGMGAVWVVVLLLRLGTGQPSPMMASVPAAKIPSPQIFMASLRENRRQLAELIGARLSENQSHELLLPPKPRSDRREDVLTA